MVKLVGLSAALVFLVLFAPACGDAESEVETTQGNSGSSAWGGITDGVPYAGQVTMEEEIVYAEAVARVNYRSARQTIEEIRLGDPDRYSTLYANSLEITFEVVEYLMGSGGSEIKAVVYDRDGWRYTRAEVEALNENLIPLRTTVWDDREAIVFLHSGHRVVSTFDDADQYWMASFRNNGEDGYTVASRWVKAWLPDAAAPDSEGGTSQTEQRFLINLSSTSGAGVQGDTMTVSELKALVTRIQNELTAGGTEEHASCVRDKYFWARYAQYRKNLIENEWGRDYNHQHEKEISSGAPAGTEVYVDIEAERFAEDPIPDSLDIDVLLLHLGQDGDLFDKVWPRNAVTGRPLPQGTYRFYWFVQGPYNALCDGVPELVKTRDEVIVTVTASEGTLHETMFDPVTFTGGVGASTDQGAISHRDFSVGGFSGSVSVLRWNNGKVVMRLDPFVSLAGYRLDFIELNGNAGLSLDASSATEDSAAKTLTWSVPTQPWDDWGSADAADTDGPTGE